MFLRVIKNRQMLRIAKKSVQMISRHGILLYCNKDFNIWKLIDTATKCTKFFFRTVYLLKHFLNYTSLFPFPANNKFN